ncbi:hypothetical protein ACO0M4_33940 [Streptomyces sp. RGM 3693]|uniref:hypothetical protein n=1 Tax=Streptomyces sp. RGM 3693 TaxID=3413284 RepID=UPI003D29DF49
MEACTQHRRPAQPSERALWPFIDQMPRAEFHPVGRSTWPKVRDTLRQRIGAAVEPGGDRRALLKTLQKAAQAAEAARPAAAQPEDVAP